MSTSEVTIVEQFASPAGRVRRLWGSTVGKKLVMAVTGILGVGFVVVHMAGNLQMFKQAGAAQAMHDYAVALRALGPLLWVARAGLIVVVALHVVAAVQLTRINRAARPVGYAERRAQVSTWGARTMRVGGAILVAFIVFHLADMTWGWGHPAFIHLDPYHNLRVGFQRWWAVVFYLAAIVSLGFHLYHGAWASWRTLGARRASPRPRHRTLAIVIAVAVSAGFAVVPLAAALGLFRESIPVMHASERDVPRPPGR
jgi:succinate dehydrogenase / fumarate reductase cytochrome b subunit